MLSHLSIQGLAIIESLSIDFHSGFNVITGETGAGKSILIKALNAVMGGKLATDAIRQGWDQATIAARFVVPTDHPSLLILSNLGIPADDQKDGAHILIRRQVTMKGRSQSWINDTPITAHPLREVGTTLLDVFSQHENQKMLDSAHHIRYVDSFIKESTVKTKLDQALRATEKEIQSVRELVNSFRSGLKDRDYIQFRAESLKKFSPSEEDYLEVKTLCEQASTRVGLRDKIVQIVDCLTAGEKDQSVARYLFEASKFLSKMSDPDLAKLNERLLTAANEIEEIHFAIEKMASSVDVDEGALEEAQARLYGYQDLFRKHNLRDVTELVAEHARMEEELKFLDSAATRLKELLDSLARSTKQVGQCAETLTKARKDSATVIRKRVQSELQELAMPGCVFEIEFQPYRRTIAELDLNFFDSEVQKSWSSIQEKLNSVGELGAERAQFLLASNPGEPSLPLNKIASGGELSRIMLAFKKALAADAETCVLVFDEIDTGISGRVADVVGRKMRELSDEFQVLCISHLPQVAVYADTHFLVKKEGKKDRTETHILKLTPDQSAREIARLLSGAQLSTPSLENAKALIAKAKSKKGRSDGASSRL